MEVKDIISSGLLELYVTGAASQEEALQVEQWAEQYPEVKREIEELQGVMESYALAEVITPDAALKEKIFTRIQQSGSKDKILSKPPSSTNQKAFSVIKNPEKDGGAKVYSLPSYIKWAVAASIVLLLGSIILNYIFYNNYRTTSKDLQIAQQELQKQQQIAEAMNKDMEVMTDKNAMNVVLNGTEKAPDALAKIFWMKNTGDVYVDPTNLPKAPAGKQYQLWAIVDGKPVDAGMIPITIGTEKGIYHIQKMKSFGKAQAFAITLEKAGGSPTPTMDQMIVHAKI